MAQVLIPKIWPKCLNCGKKLKPVKDPKTKKYTGYLWRCKCSPGLIISIG